MYDDLNENNFMLYAAKCYDKPNSMMSEFEEDLQRIKYIKRLIKRYKATGELKERLILNHIIILTNVFGIEPTVRMLFMKHDEEDYSILKTFLLFLNFLPNIIKEVNGKTYNSKDITIDLFVGKRLRDI